MMNVAAAMTELVALARTRSDQDSPEFRGMRLELSGPASLNHLQFMLDTLRKEVWDEPRRNRWLGYAQGVLVATGVATLDEMRALSRRHG